MDLPPPEDFVDVIKYNITQTIYSVEDFDLFANTCQKLNIKGKIHLKIDCGMGRIGFSNSKDLKALFFELNENQNLIIEGIFMHPPMSDSGNLIKAQEQLQDFINLVKEIKELNIPIIHATNSASIIELEKSHFNMVRTGAALYGYYSSDFVHKKLDLKPVLSLKAKLIHVKEVLKGTAIGYGGSYITSEKTKIGTIPIGFGDGYPKSLTNKTFVLIKGVRCQIVGKIAMDMMMVDLKDLDVKKNEEVVLIGTQGTDYLSAYEVANFAGLYEFELMCNLSLRLKRNYYKNGGLIWNI